MTIDLFWLAGTHESNATDPDSISGHFLSRLDRRLINPVIVPFPQDYGMPTAFAASNSVGRSNLIRAIRGTSRLAMAGGYSAGAWIAGSLAADIDRARHVHPGQVDDLEVVGCALMADPGRPLGVTYPGEPDPGGCGVLGPRRVIGIPTWWAAASGDPITSLPAGSPLRLIADLTPWWTTDPRGWTRWLESITSIIAHGGVQRWWEHTTPADLLLAAQQLVWFMVGTGRHTIPYATEGLAKRLAEHVNLVVGNA